MYVFLFYIFYVYLKLWQQILLSSILAGHVHRFLPRIGTHWLLPLLRGGANALLLISARSQAQS